MDERAEIARWVAGRRAAEAREREEQRDAPVVAADSFARALSLISFAARRHGWPLPVSAADEAENLAFHATWARLRERLRG